VKPGYKQTEFGVLPADWDAGPVGRAVERLEAGASVNSEKDEASEFDSYPCVLKTGAARGGSFDPRESKRVARRDLWRLKVSLRKDTILVSRMNTVELVGESGYVGADYPNLFVPDRMWMTTIRSTGRVHPRWLSYILAWQPVKSRISASATGTSGSMKNISKPSFRTVEIPYPPVEEQRTIAEALSDADGLIESLEQLLTKKRQLKQGAMQELLTGKKRLPGFSGEWDVNRLEELAEIRSGGTPSTTQSQFWDGDVVWCTPTDITGLKGFKYLGDTGRRISQLGLRSSSAEIVPANSVVMTSRATIGECAINQLPVSTNQGFKNFTPFENLDVEFLYYLLLTRKQDFISLCGGSTFLEIGKAQLAAFEVRVPATRAEQSAIAAILSDMDAEIAALETKLTKARQLKEGMMQELLTGRIRLV